MNIAAKTMAGMASGPSNVEAIALARTFFQSALAPSLLATATAVASKATFGWALKFVAAAVACKTTTRCSLL